MRIVFIKNVKNVARIGDIKNVPDGYARNYLFPEGLAAVATAAVISKIDTFKKISNEREKLSKQKAEELAAKLTDRVFEITEEANVDGHLYGSVDEEKIKEALKGEGILLSQEFIKLPHHLKNTGEHAIEIELHPEVLSKVKILVKAKKG